MSVKLEDIAKETGFSISTVSRVLSNSSYPVSGQICGKVLRVAEVMGYQPDRANRAEHELYRPLLLKKGNGSSTRKVKLIAIPYYAWGNRGLKSMRVWIPYAQAS